MTFNVPKEDSEGYVNNKKDLYKFKFEEVFQEKTEQDTIFEKVFIILFMFLALHCSNLLLLLSKRKLLIFYKISIFLMLIKLLLTRQINSSQPKVCKNAAESARNGYNATIFAYGQTGSGKF